MKQPAVLINPRLEGRYNLVVRSKETGEVVRETGFFPNLITSAGLNRLGTGGIGNYCQVGSGSIAPSVNDTGLVSRVASTSENRDMKETAQSSAPYFWSLSNTYRFAEGVAAGNLSEVGIGWGADGFLFSRALILDAQGNPTSITVLANEFLDVTYELRIYIPTTDSTQTLTLNGVDYNVLTRAMDIAGVVAQTAYRLFYIGVTNNEGYEYTNFLDGDIGTIFQGPAGTANGPEGRTATPYVNNSLYKEFVYSSSLDASNFAGGIKSMRFSTNIGRFQSRFTPPLPKDNTKRLTFPVRIAWARKT